MVQIFYIYVHELLSLALDHHIGLGNTKPKRHSVYHRDSQVKKLQDNRHETRANFSKYFEVLFFFKGGCLGYLPCLRACSPGVCTSFEKNKMLTV